MSDAILEHINRLVLAFPKQEISPGTIASYVEDLSDIPPDVLGGICRHLRLTEEWFPTVAKIRALWFETVFGPASPSESLDWCLRELFEIKAIPGIHPVGHDPVPTEFPDPITQEAVRLYGWDRIRIADPEWLPKEWAKVYERARLNITERFVSGQIGRAHV